ncbi:hypothetical protein K474DRAFT_1774914 [Panus rudis PR-1116 ss-1]|nr:hypothetical protein K474DRAFT_1774914 [Panus rudis PR-1116 ss-1]
MAGIEKPPTVVDVEASRQARLEKQKTRYRDRGGIFVPAETNPLLDILLKRGPNGESPTKLGRTRSQSASPTRNAALRRRDNTESPIRVTVSQVGRGKGTPAKAAKTAPSKTPAKPRKSKIEPPKKNKEDATKGPVADDTSPIAGPSRLPESAPVPAKSRKSKVKAPPLASSDEDEPPGLRPRPGNAIGAVADGDDPSAATQSTKGKQRATKQRSDASEVKVKKAAAKAPSEKTGKSTKRPRIEEEEETEATAKAPPKRTKTKPSTSAARPPNTARSKTLVEDEDEAGERYTETKQNTRTRTRPKDPKDTDVLEADTQQAPEETSAKATSRNRLKLKEPSSDDDGSRGQVDNLAVGEVEVDTVVTVSTGKQKDRDDNDKSTNAGVSKHTDPEASGVGLGKESGARKGPIGVDPPEERARKADGGKIAGRAAGSKRARKKKPTLMSSEDEDERAVDPPTSKGVGERQVGKRGSGYSDSRKVVEKDVPTTHSKSEASSAKSRSTVRSTALVLEEPAVDSDDESDIPLAKLFPRTRKKTTSEKTGEDFVGNVREGDVPPGSRTKRKTKKDADIDTGGSKRPKKRKGTEDDVPVVSDDEAKPLKKAKVVPLPQQADDKPSKKGAQKPVLKSASRGHKENQQTKPVSRGKRKPMPRLSLFPLPETAPDSDADPIDFL